MYALGRPGAAHLIESAADTMAESTDIPSLAIGLIVVLCAWLYPRLNRWVYERRMAREHASAQRAGATQDSVPKGP